MASHAHTQFDHVTFPSIHRHAHRSASTELDSVFLSPLTYEIVVETSQAKMSRSGALVMVVFLSSLLGKAFSFVTSLRPANEN